MRRWSSLRWVVLGAVVLVGAAVLLAPGGSSSPRKRPERPREVLASASTAAPGTAARFAYLAQQMTNSCGMRAQTALALSDGRRLQGSCCSAMDRDTYLKQVEGLKRYAAVQEIPRDPYDIPIPLVKRLWHYERTIRLTAPQRRTYDRAMQMTKEGGPCCCHCWRWEAFGGLAKRLIARRRWSAQEVARVIGLLDGCGGRREHPGEVRPAAGGAART